ncbi:MAG: hypothetical protein JXR37_17160 [Kiritimatiellae bacterium]|nr:hypothetical protein [Kiritimatiellia bacterium]
MKYAGLAVISLILGFVLGGWGPRSDLKQAKRENEELRRELRRQQRRGKPNLADVTGMLRIPDADEPGKAGQPARAGAGGPPPAQPDSAARGRDEMPASEEAGARNQNRQRRSLAERIQEAADLWRVRADLARHALVANANLSQDETVQLDVLLASMNIRLRAGMEQAVANFTSGEMLDSEAAVRMMHELTGALVLTYDEFDRTLPEGWRNVAGEDFMLLDFVDPATATPLTEIEDKLRSTGRQRRQRFR